MWGMHAWRIRTGSMPATVKANALCRQTHMHFWLLTDLHMAHKHWPYTATGSKCVHQCDSHSSSWPLQHMDLPYQI